MKYLSIFSILFLPFTLSAQDNLCQSSYMPFKEEMTLEYTTYNAKGKEEGRQKQSVSVIEETGNGFTATISFEVYGDKDDEAATTGSFDVACDGENIKMDISRMVSPTLMETYQNMDVEITGDDLHFPNNPKEGQELPDGTMEIKANMSGLGAMTTTVNLINRKVEGFEKVTTPAGTFDCVRISQETEVSVMGMKRRSKSIDWLAKGIGTVKTENFNQRGKSEGTMVLTKVEE